MKKILFIFIIIFAIFSQKEAFAVEYSRTYTIYPWLGDAVEIRSATYAPDEETASGQLAGNICVRQMYEVLEMKLSDRENWEAAQFSGDYYRSNSFNANEKIINPMSILPNRGCLCEENFSYNYEKDICEPNTKKSEKTETKIEETKKSEKIFEGMQMEMRTTVMWGFSENNRNLQNFLIAMGYYNREADGIMTIWVLGALRKYQFDNGEIQTGRPDLRTQQHMKRDITKLLQK